VTDRLGDIVGLHLNRSTIAKIEQDDPEGRRRVTIDELVAFALLFEVSPMELIGVAPEPEPDVHIAGEESSVRRSVRGTIGTDFLESPIDFSCRGAPASQKMAAYRERRKAEAERHHDEWAHLLNDGIPVKQVAKRYGVSCQTVSQVAHDRGINTRQLQAKLRHQGALYAKVMAAMASATVCPVCMGWVLRSAPGRRPGERRMCSPDCSETWRVGRYAISDDAREKHRLACAMTVLRRPEKYKAAELAKAEEMLSDNPPPPNRRYRLPASESTAMLNHAISVRRSVRNPSGNQQKPGISENESHTTSL